MLATCAQKQLCSILALSINLIGQTELLAWTFIGFETVCLSVFAGVALVQSVVLRCALLNYLSSLHVARAQKFLSGINFQQSVIFRSENNYSDTQQ